MFAKILLWLCTTQWSESARREKGGRRRAGGGEVGYENKMLKAERTPAADLLAKHHASIRHENLHLQKSGGKGEM